MEKRRLSYILLETSCKYMYMIGYSRILQICREHLKVPHTSIDVYIRRRWPHLQTTKLRASLSVVKSSFNKEFLSSKCYLVFYSLPSRW